MIKRWGLEFHADLVTLSPMLDVTAVEESHDILDHGPLFRMAGLDIR